nr:2a protein [Bromoviridae sp.]
MSFIPDFEYEVPAFQWLIDDSLKRKDDILEVEEVTPIENPKTEVVADGTLESFVLAVQPLVVNGGYEPPFDQGRWNSICETVNTMVDMYKDRPLIPVSEMARMLYLNIEGSFVDESEIDDWRPEDTSDWYVPECDSGDGNADLVPCFESTSKIDSHCRPGGDSEESSDDGPLDPVNIIEETLGDNYQVMSEEFVDFKSDYDITLNLMHPIERRIGHLEATLPDRGHGTIDEGPCFIDRVSLNSLEAAGHKLLPTHAYFNDTYYQALEENADCQYDFNRLTLRQSDVDWYKDPDKYYEPSMSIGSFQKRIGTQKTVLTALKKRNADVPEMGDVVNIKAVAKDVAKKFFSTFFNSDGRNLVHQSMDVLARGLEYHKKWKDHKELAGVTLATEHNLSRYQHMIKSDIKPVVTDTLHLERAVAATITFHGKGVTSCFSPFFTACFEKLSMALRSRFIVPIGKISSLELKNVPINNKWFLEADLSKFDKSQGELHLEFQREILIQLGFPLPLTNWWCDFHRSSLLVDPSAKVSMPVSFQRRTGDAFTYFGNTLVTMAMMSYTTDLSDCVAIFSGDDSLIISNKQPHLDTSYFSSLFNMEIKVMDPSLPYVCSKFLLETELGDLVSVPDPLREIQRMSKRKILKDKEMLRAHFMSFQDRMKFVRSLNEKMIDMLCKFTCLKYKKPDCEMQVRMALAAFGYYSENFLRFSQCYVTEGQHIYKFKDPLLNFLELEPDPDRSDASYFKNWFNPKFPDTIDKIFRWVGCYDKRGPDPLIDLKKSRFMDESEMNSSMLLAMDRRALQQRKLNKSRKTSSVDLIRAARGVPRLN